MKQSYIQCETYMLDLVFTISSMEKNTKLCSSINLCQRGKDTMVVWLMPTNPGQVPPGDVSSEIKVGRYVVIINATIIWYGRSITRRLDGQYPSSFNLVSLTY